MDDITHHDTFRLSGVFPQFSPDGTRLAYVGSPVYEFFNRSDYQSYSPVSQALAYAGFAQNSLGILLFSPAEAGE